MKIITNILLSVVLFSCGMSKSEKSKIETMITLHNAVVNTNFVMDSLKEMEKESIINIRIYKTDEFKDYLRTHGIVFKNEWNKPYQISKDYNLTFNKYLEYCKANNKDPKTFYKFMD